MAPQMRIMTVVGTRPEIIRLSCTLRRLDEVADHTLVHTGQNYDYELSKVFFDEMALRPPDRFLGVDTSSLGSVLGGTLLGMEQALLDVKPHALLVLGDTNSCVAAIMAKRMQVPVYHMEAGNRCFDANVPEETNRRLIDHIADFNLCYTEHARRNLLAEGLPTRRVTVTGSPMGEVLGSYRAQIDASTALDGLELEPGRYVLVSAHREETVDEPDRLGTLMRTLDDVSDAFQMPIVLSTHPRTSSRLRQFEIDQPPGVRSLPPFGFFDYVQLQRHAFCVLSDSGTIGEESGILGFPAVTIRDAIERPEALEAGTLVSSGLESPDVLDAIRLVTGQRVDDESPPPPSEYTVSNFSQRVVNFVRSTIHAHHAWDGVRRRSEIWTT